jgi:hypothetical protein
MNVDTAYLVSNIHILQTPMRFEMSIEQSKFSYFPLGYGCDYLRLEGTCKWGQQTSLKR